MMKKNIKDWKFVIILASFWFLFIISYFIVNIYLDNKALEKSFETYKYYNIEENSSKLSYLKTNLMNDKYFVNLVLFSEYDGSLNVQNSKELLRYYLFSLNKDNKRIYTIDDEYTEMCMSKLNFYTSIKELFGVEKDDYVSVLENTNFITTRADACFDLSALDGIDTASYVGVNSFSVDELGVITCNLYYYSIYTNEEGKEETVSNLLLKSLQNNELDKFNTTFENDYNGVVENKIVKFKENPNGDYFKYSLISIKTLE